MLMTCVRCGYHVVWLRQVAKISVQPAATLILVLVSCWYLVFAVIPRDPPLSDWRLAA